MQKRSLALDAMKLLACVGVAVIHLSGYGLELFPIGSFSWLSSAFWDSLARFAVPVFFMCTGALMLPPARRLDAKTVWKKYFLRVLIILLFWSWAYYMLVVAGQYILIRWTEENFLINSIVHTLKFDHYFHLYYLQILLLLYALLPVLRVFTRAATEREMRYALAVWAVLGLLPACIDRWSDILLQPLLFLLSGRPLGSLMEDPTALATLNTAPAAAMLTLAACLWAIPLYRPQLARRLWLLLLPWLCLLLQPHVLRAFAL